LHTLATSTHGLAGRRLHPRTFLNQPALPLSLLRSDKPCKPFRCLDPQYRRELVRSMSGLRFTR